MLHRFFARSVLCASAMLLAALPLCAGATELGEPLVRSHIGQPLVADIELSGFVENQAVQVKLAHPEVYNAASIRMHPILANLTMSVMRRDGRQYLHITSIKALESEYVHLFLELADGNRRDIRGVTLWLTPDPQPAPPPPPKVVAMPVAPPPVTIEPPAAAPEPAHAAPAKPSPLRPSAAACKPQYTADQIRTCAALDYKNGALTAQIVELEEKVRVLQLSLEGKKPAPAAASTPPDAAHAVPASAAPPPIKAPAKLAVPPAKAKPVVSPFPWLWIGIGAGVLLLGAGGGFWFWKRKKGTKGEAPATSKPGMLARLKARFGKKPKEEIVDARIEPAAE